MAGGKETPRQKMIGMMYLFLTAMLAINVSDSLLHRFLFINDTLEVAKEATNEKNTAFLGAIEKAVDERGNKQEDKDVFDLAAEVRSRAATTLAHIDQIKEEWIEETGGRVEGQLVGFKNHEAIAFHMITEGQADELAKELNAFAEDVRKMVDGDPSEFMPLALNGDEHPSFRDDPNQAKKDFAHLFFENTPLAAGMATMTQFENEVLRYETNALEILADKVGAKNLEFDVIKAMVRPVSQRVAAGTRYEADLFIAASSSALIPTMSWNGNSIDVDSTGVGKVTFIAPAADEYDEEGLAERQFKAEIQLNVPGQGDTTFTEMVTYYIVKPTIQIQSQAVNALYYQCGNELTVQVPALGTSYNPTFEAAGATVVMGDQPGLVTLIPTSNKVVLTVFNDGNEIGTQEFDVRAVPRPEVQIQQNGRVVQSKQGIRTQALTSLEAKVIPDEDFARMLPNDARYRVAEWKVTLASGPRPKGEPLTFNNKDGSLRAFRARARSGDRLVIEVNRVIRRNYQDQTQPVRINFQPLSIPIN